jgi:aryl carrier-like protein
MLTKVSAELVPTLRSYLKENLPEYMVPAYFFLLETLPLTANGKLDRRALPLYEYVKLAAELEKELQKPCTDSEAFMAETWKQVLELPEVGINSNFFELGGDSINAIRMISRLNREGFGLSLRDLYKNQTIKDLCAAIEKPGTKQNKEEETPDRLIIEMDLDMEELARGLPAGVEIVDVYPATPLQCHMLNYLHNHKVIEPPVFIYQRRFLPTQVDLDIPVLEQAIQETVDAFPLLRTILFWEHLKEPVQVICKKARSTVIYRDFSHLSGSEQKREITALMREEWQRGCDPHKDIPFRPAVVKLFENRHQFFFTGDYSRLDGWGLMFVVRHAMACYEALLSGSSFRRENNTKNTAYKTYLSNLKKQDPGKIQKYWQSVFKGFTRRQSLIERLPGNNPGQEKGFGQQHLYISSRTTARLDRILRSRHLLFSTVVKAIWTLMLGTYTNQEDIVHGFLTTGRSMASADIESMEGYSINVLPVRMKITPDQLLMDWLRQILEDQLEWTRYENTQIEKIYEWLDISMEKPLFETFVVVQNINRDMGKINPKYGASRAFGLFHAKMECPLRLDIDPGVEICVALHYYRRCFSDAVIDRLLENFKTLIESIVTSPNQTVGELMQVIRTESNSIKKVILEKMVM